MPRVTLNNNSFNNGGAVWAAATYNLLIPVYSGNRQLWWLTMRHSMQMAIQ